MKITLTKFVLKNGDTCIDNDYSHCSYSPIEKEYKQEIEVDETKWKEIKDE